MERFRLVCVALLVAIMSMGTCQGGKVEPFRTWHVKVTNLMSKSEVTLHCMSVDNDIGFQEVRPGQFISWKFKIDVTASTHFWCNAWSETSPRRYHMAFDVFRAENPQFEGLCEPPDSNWCVWDIRDGGLYSHLTHLRVRTWEVDKDPAGAEAPETAFLDIYR